MSNLRQAAQAALEALLAADLAMANGGILACHASRKQIAAAIEALRAALAEPQPEPLTPEQRAVISPAALRRYDEACKAAPQAQKTQTAANSKSRLKRLSALGAPLCSGCGNEIG